MVTLGALENIPLIEVENSQSCSPMGKQKRNTGKGVLSSKINLKEFHANLIQGKLFPSSFIQRSDKIGKILSFYKINFMLLRRNVVMKNLS